MMQRLLGAATRTPLSDLDPARTEWLREIFHDRCARAGIDHCRRSAGAAGVHRGRNEF
jgi:hypothetical protein